jgi:hypothetical protein
MKRMTQNRLKLLSVGNAILASVMVVCLAVAVARLILALLKFPSLEQPAVQAMGLLGLFLVALEVQFTRRWQEYHFPFSHLWWKAILTEWGLLSLGMLTFVWLAKGGVITLPGILALPKNALLDITRSEYFLGFCLLGLTWSASRYLVSALSAMENSALPVSGDPIIGAGKEQSIHLSHMGAFVLFFGGLSVFLSIFGMSIMRIARGLPTGYGSLGAEVPLYFACSLGLFAIGRVLILLSDWQWEKTHFQAGIIRPWLVYGFGFILVVWILSLALPTQYSFDLVSSLNRVLFGLGYIGMLFWSVVLLPILYLLSRLSSLLFMKSKAPAGEVPTEAVPTAEAASHLPALPSGWDWGQIAREILFWVMLLVVVLYIIRQGLPLIRSSILRPVWRGPMFRRLRRLILTLRRRFASWGTAAGMAIQKSWRQVRDDIAKRTGVEKFGFLNLRDLSPRQSVRFYFFALLRRGGEQGIIRQAAQTPREYAARLTQAGSGFENEVLEMTAAFEEARYTSHEIGPEYVSRVRKIWDTVRWSLRPDRRKDRTGGKS